MLWHELNTGLCPWDLHDEGIERILDNLQREAGCNAAYLTALKAGPEGGRGDLAHAAERGPGARVLCRLHPARHLREPPAGEGAGQGGLFPRPAALLEQPRCAGLHLTKIAPFVESVRMTYYAEQTGDVEKVRGKGKWLATVRRQVGEDIKVISAIAPRGKAAVELIKLGVRIVAENGADGLSFAFYDGAKLQYLRAIREAMEEAEITLVSQ